MIVFLTVSVVILSLAVFFLFILQTGLFRIQKRDKLLLTRMIEEEICDIPKLRRVDNTSRKGMH